MSAAALHSTAGSMSEAIPMLLGHPRLRCRMWVAAADLAGQAHQSDGGLLCYGFCSRCQIQVALCVRLF